MNRTFEESEKGRVWSLLSEAGLIDIPADEFAQRIKEAKDAVMGRLGELLELTADMKERESAAYSLATLKKLETTLERNGSPRSSA
jgi:hypothetical protein